MGYRRIARCEDSLIGLMAGAVLLAGSIGAPFCATVPHSGEVITGAYAECRAAALEVQFQLTELATSDGDAYPIYQSKLREFALTQAANLAPCEARP